MKITEFPRKAVDFIKEVKVELKRVTWPTRQETIKHTFTIILFTLVVAAILGGLDFVFSWILNKFVI